MRIYRGLLLLVFLAGCLSTDQVARNRNAYFSDYNYYTRTKFWRSIDVVRFGYNLAAVRFAILAEPHTIDEMLKQPYLCAIRDSLQHEIEARNKAFQSLKSMYFDTTDTGRRQIYTGLKSDSLDKQTRIDYQDSPYFELLEDIYHRYRTAVDNSLFYQSQSAFEDYLRNRSFTAVDTSTLKKIFNGSKVGREVFKGETIRKLKEEQIDFVVLFSVSYSSDYSEQAEARVGEERIKLTCFSLAEDKIIGEAESIHFLEDNPGQPETR